MKKKKRRTRYTGTPKMMIIPFSNQNVKRNGEILKKIISVLTPGFTVTRLSLTLFISK